MLYQSSINPLNCLDFPVSRSRPVFFSMSFFIRGFFLFLFYNLILNFCGVCLCCCCFFCGGLFLSSFFFVLGGGGSKKARKEFAEVKIYAPGKDNRYKEERSYDPPG